ncbi:MAG: glycosyltransferase family 4 protein [Lachnospiraceae bacterium]|nr:glycosyltransferase family 4 protein [Lachnospiraceae bacterium]MDE7240057.1 glycosyltransferase family 4 protein [Lachnospiraceae bacterium]
MKEIGVWVDGKNHNGGSYQFWLSIVKAVSELNRAEYHVIVLSSDDQWIAIADQYELDSVKLNGVKGRLNQRIENSYWGYRHVPVIKSVLSFLYQHTDCNIRIAKKIPLDLCIAGQVDLAGDLVHIPMMIPIFDLMHRYDDRFPELTSEYQWRERMYRHQCETAEIILADSKVGKRHIVESYGWLRKDLDKHVSVLPFIPPDYIYLAKESPVKEPLFDKFFFYPAQFWTHKNHKNLILAASGLKKKGIPVKLIFVGSEQNNKENVLNLIHQEEMQDDIRILGYVSNEEMVYLYRHARAMVMPTCLGPTNIPQLEAFVLGCPVATSGIYGIPEQVGDAALLFDPDSVEEIADCMERLWTDDGLCAELVKKGRERADKWGQPQFNVQFEMIIHEYFEREER